jgi:hypothetical protein
MNVTTLFNTVVSPRREEITTLFNTVVSLRREEEDKII